MFAKSRISVGNPYIIDEKNNNKSQNRCSAARVKHLFCQYKRAVRFTFPKKIVSKNHFPLALSITAPYKEVKTKKDPVPENTEAIRKEE